MSAVGPRLHGALDYVTVALFLAAPSVLGFTGLSAGACYVLAVAHLVLTMLTDFPFGVRGSVSFRLHRAAEFLVAVVLIVGPWILAAEVPLGGRVFFGAMGAAILALGLASGRGRGAKPKRRKREEAPDAGAEEGTGRKRGGP